MAGETEYIREYLVGLGFQVDTNQLTKMNKALELVSSRVFAVGAVAVAATAATIDFMVKTARSLDDLYWASQRIGTTVGHIEGYEYAIKNLGGSAEGARAMLEGLGSAIRSNPGVEALLNSLGVATRDPKDPTKIIDRVQVMAQLGARLRAMPFFIARQYAETLGIYTSDADLLALENGDLQKNMKEVDDIYKRMGTDAQDVAKKSHDFSVELNKLSITGDIVAVKLQGGLLWTLKQINDELQIGIGSYSWLWGNDPKSKVSGEGKGFLGTRATGDIPWTSPQTPTEAAAAKKDKIEAGKASDRIASAMAYYMKVGWSVNQAASIVANLYTESGLLAHPKGSNDHGHAQGAAQWQGPRQADFKAWAGYDIRKSGLAKQLEFFQYELTKGKYKNVGAMLRKENNPVIGGAIVSHFDEGPYWDLINQISRGNLARKIANSTISNSKGTNIHIHQENKTTIHGAHDPHATGAAVSKAQNQTNGDLLRNLKGAAR